MFQSVALNWEDWTDGTLSSFVFFLVSVFHFYSAVKKRWSVTAEAQPVCIFNVLAACTVAVAIKLHLNALRLEVAWQRRFHHHISIFNLVRKEKFRDTRREGRRGRSYSLRAAESNLMWFQDHRQHEGENERLKIKDSFKNICI